MVREQVALATGSPDINTLVASAADGCVFLSRPLSSQLFFVFAGARTNTPIAPTVFLGRTRLMERNIVLFRDKDEVFYHSGVSSAVSSMSALTVWQRHFVQALPQVTRVYCLGTSMGAYAALLSGHLIKADAVWALAPITNIEGHPFVKGLQLPEGQADLASTLAIGNGHTVYNVFYNDRCEQDRRAAHRLRGCPGVKCFPQAGRGHDIVRTLANRRLLDRLLPPVE